MRLSPALFLDRDGTLIKEKGYLADPGAVELLPGVAEGLLAARKMGFKLVVVSNQSGVARGLFPESRVREVNLALSELLAARGAVIDKFYYCPHHPQARIAAYRGACLCRKPRPGQLWQAKRELKLDFRRSFMVGDKIADVETGKAAKVKTVLLLTGAKSRYEGKPLRPCLPDFAARNFLESIEWISKVYEKFQQINQAIS